MSPERWRQIEDLYHAALERTEDQRPEFLRHACAGDRELREEVESLLSSSRPTQAVLVGPAPEAAALVQHPPGVPSPGQTVSHYRILHKLGEGGMGIVYQAEDTTLGRQVALKVLPPELAADPRRKARLVREARAASALNHPNIVTVHEVASSDGLEFIVMELISGQPLSKSIPAKGMQVKEALRLAVQIADGLATAHAAGIVHRDLKPGNIMLTGDGRAKLLDFGLAKYTEGGLEVSQTQTLEGAVVGTVAYMSPEQAEGKVVDARSDVFSFGAVLYEMLTGKCAFSRGSAASTLAAILKEDPPPPSELARGVPAGLELVILRCLRKDPAARFQRMDEVRAMLDQFERELESGATSPETVAAAGEEFGGSVREAVLCLVAALGFLFLGMLLRTATSLHSGTQLELPPDALAAKAREIASSLGYRQKPLDTASGFSYDTAYLSQLTGKARWSKVKDHRPTPAYFWYRESPWPLGAVGPDVVTPVDPPSTIPGMISIQLDTQGRLAWFQAVPPVRLSASDSREADWNALFTAAGLDIGQFTPVPAEWHPLVSSNVRRAWKGIYPGQPDLPVRVEAASLAGKTVFFRIIEPWVTTAPNQTPIRDSSLRKAFSLVVYLGVCWLAWRNLRSGRGDRQAAFRFGSCMLVTRLIYMAAAGEFRHYFGLGQRYEWKSFGDALFFGGVAWAAYMALEPLIRRKWPHSLLSWSRMLAGRLRDPLLGRDILVGVAAGCAAAVLNLIAQQMVSLASGRVVPQWPLVADIGTDMAWFIGQIASLSNWIVLWSLLQAVLFVVLWMLVRSRWAAGALLWALATCFWASVANRPELFPLYLLFHGVVWAVNVAVLLRFGVTAFTIAFLTDGILIPFPPSLDFSAWYESFGQAAAAIAIALAVYGFYTALGGRRVFRGKFLGGEV